MTLGSHQKTVGKSQVHLTPRFIIDALGPFDLDPCAATRRPFDCARVNYTRKDDGLKQKWGGYTWCNPPFDQYQVAPWVDRMASHGNGILLLHARLETAWFRPCWKFASGMLALYQRVTFLKPSGKPHGANSGAPVVLVAFGRAAYDRLRYCELEGAFIYNWFGDAGYRYAR